MGDFLKSQVTLKPGSNFMSVPPHLPKADAMFAMLTVAVETGTELRPTEALVLISSEAGNIC